MVGWKRSAMFCSVNRPWLSWKPPMARKLVGRIRNMTANTKKGTTPTQAHETWPSRDVAADEEDRSGAGAATVAMTGPGAGGPLPRRSGGGDGGSRSRRGDHFTLAPTTVSHCLVITCLDWSCCSRVGNMALA